MSAQSWLDVAYVLQREEAVEADRILALQLAVARGMGAEIKESDIPQSAVERFEEELEALDMEDEVEDSETASALELAAWVQQVNAALG